MDQYGQKQISFPPQNQYHLAVSEMKYVSNTNIPLNIHCMQFI